MLLERGTIYMVPGDRGGCDQVRQEAEAFRYSFNNPLPPTINSRNAPPSLPEPIEKLAAGCANQLFAVSLGFFFFSFLFLHLLSSSVVVVIAVIIVVTTFAFLFGFPRFELFFPSSESRVEGIANRVAN